MTYLLELVCALIFGITGAFLIHFLFSSELLLTVPIIGIFVFVLGGSLIVLCFVMLIDMTFCVSLFKLFLEKNLIIENWCLCFKNKNCSIKLVWLKKLTCYQNGKLLFEIEAKYPIFNYLIRVFTPFFKVDVFKIFQILIRNNKLNKTTDAKSILEYINEYMNEYMNTNLSSLDKRYYSIYVNDSLISASPSINKAEKKKSDINNSSLEEKNNSSGVNTTMTEIKHEDREVDL